jgi:death-on-curing protein
MIYLSLEQVLELHDALIEKHGGLQGIRDTGLLESALGSPMMAVFGEELYKTVYDKAAAYLFNKRTASASCLIFLRVNGKHPKYKINNFIDFVVDVAQGKYDLAAISDYLSKICH